MPGGGLRELRSRNLRGLRGLPEVRVRQAAGLVLAAELGHLVLILGEWPQWALRGLFHTAAAMALGLLAARLWFGPGRRALRRGVVLTVALPVLWLASRTVGIPSYLTLQPLPVGVVDVLTSVVEAGAAALLVTELWRRRDGAP